MNITFLIGHMVKERDLILYELAMDLGKKGDSVTIISGYPSRRITEEVRGYYLSHRIEKYDENITSIRVGTKNGEGKGLLTRMIKYCFLSYHIYKKAKTIPTDVYYIYSTPPFLGYFSQRLSKIAPVVYNAQDLFPDSLVKVKGIKESNIFIRLFRSFEKKVYQNSAKIITISEDMKQNIMSHGADKEKIEVIHNWADTIAIHHVDRNNNILFDEFGLERGYFYISYAGDIGLHQNIQLFLEVAKRLKKAKLDIGFVFIGNGAYVDEMLKIKEENELDNVLLFPLQPIERISEVYSLGDVEIVSLEPDMMKMALPSKVWSIMAAGSPVIALLDKNCELQRIIQDNQLGTALYERDVNILEEEILRLYAMDRNSLKQFGLNARRYIENNNTREGQTQKYLDILKDTASAFKPKQEK